MLASGNEYDTDYYKAYPHDLSKIDSFMEKEISENHCEDISETYHRICLGKFHLGQNI